MRLSLIDNSAHFLLFFLCQFNIRRSPVLLETVYLGRARDGDHPLSSNPSERYLAGRATFPCSKLLDLFDNSFVFVEVLSLELGSC